MHNLEMPVQVRPPQQRISESTASAGLSLGGCYTYCIMPNMLIYFLAGGAVTTLIVSLEESGYRLLSGLATLMPVFTLIAYFFIGESAGGTELSKHAELVLAGTLVGWVPYMLAVIWLAPHLGTYKTIGIALGVFFALAIAFLLFTQQYGWFQ